MKAIGFHETGDVDVLVPLDLPEPAPAPGQVVVDIKAVALNHLDVWVRRGLAGKAEPKPFGIQLTVGLSHPVQYHAPRGIKITVTNNVLLKIEGVEYDRLEPGPGHGERAHPRRVVRLVGGGADGLSEDITLFLDRKMEVELDPPDLALAGERRRLLRPTTGREESLVLRLLLVDARSRRVSLDAPRVAHDEEDAEREAEDQDDQAVDDALGEWDAGESGRDPRTFGCIRTVAIRHARVLRVPARDAADCQRQAVETRVDENVEREVLARASLEVRHRRHGRALRRDEAPS